MWRGGQNEPTGTRLSKPAVVQGEIETHLAVRSLLEGWWCLSTAIGSSVVSSGPAESWKVLVLVPRTESVVLNSSQKGWATPRRKDCTTIRIFVT